MISFKNVSKIYVDKDKATIGLRNINLDIENTGIIAVCGESGSGKSTFLKLLAKLDSPTEGEILIDGKNTSEYDLDEMDSYRFQNVSFVYQDFNIIESISVLDNVMMPLLIRNYDYHEAKMKALDVINDVGIGKLANKKCSKLSGGEKQRCAIARALVIDSKIIACDEPTANLDSDTASDIISILSRLSKGRLLIIVTHNYDQIKKYATRRICLSNNEVVLDERLNPQDEVSKDDNSYDSLSFKNTFRYSFYKLFLNFSKTFMLLLTSILFIAIVFIIFISENVSLNEWKYKNNFINPSANSVYVLANDGKEIDFELIKKYESYNINPSEEMRSVYFRINELNNSFTTYYFDEKPDLLVGRYPNDSTEVCINVEGNLSAYECNNYLNKTLSQSFINQSFKIVGVASNTKHNYIFGNDYVKTLTKLLSLNFGATLNYTGDFSNNFIPEDKENLVFSFHDIRCDENTDNTILLPESLKGNFKSIGAYIEVEGRKKYVSLDDFKKEYYNGEFVKIEIKKDFSLDKCFELMLYNVDSNKEIEYWNSNGYYAVDPLYYSLEDSVLDNSNVYLSIALAYIILFVSMILFCFIFVLLFKYHSKEYYMLRNLGLKNNRIRNVLDIDFLYYYLVGFVIALIGTIIVVLTCFKTLNFINILIKSMLFIILFGVITVISLNKFIIGKKRGELL